jgi:hypothetical protein
MRLFTLIILFVLPLGVFAQQKVVEKDGKFVDEMGNLFTGTHKELFEDGTLKSEMPIANGC